MASTPPPFDPTSGTPPYQPPPPLPPMPPETAPAEELPLPFEQESMPFLEGLYETAKLIVTSPSEAFARVRASSDLGRPLLYAVVFGWVGIIASQIYEIVLRGAFWRMIPGLGGAQDHLISTGVSIAMMVLAPVLVLIGVFIGSLILHLFVLLVGGAESGIATTVRVVCYASTVQITQVVPVCGGLIGSLWALMLYVLGLAAAHRISRGKAALAVFLPLTLCCVCLLIAVAFFGAAIWAMIAGTR